MNRTERLLNLLQILRCYRYPVSGQRLSERLNISIRTLYRDLSVLRDAIAKQKKIRIIYKSDKRKETEQIVWPFTLGYFTNERILVAWCDKLKNYQHFKTNRISAIEILSEYYPGSKDKLFREWQALQLRKHSTRG